MTKKQANKRNAKAKRQQAPKGGVQSFGTSLVMPSNQRMQLAYAERVTLNEATAGAGISTTFSLNSLYDPNSGGVGVQPVGFDQMANFYGQFKVWKCKAKVTFCNNNATAPVMCVLFGTFQPVVPSNPDAWFCQPYAVSTRIDPIGGISSRVLEFEFDIPKVLGLTKAQYTSDMDFVGTASGNPTRQAYMVVGVRSANNSTAGTVAYVQLSYLAEFMQPQALNTS